MKINREEIQKRIDQKLISVQKHPTAPLYIYNYTPLTQFQRAWDEYTLSCRGLILDEENNIIARPFHKFFNLEEHTEKLPNEPFQVTEKLDGSLGILYPLNGSYAIATRGSFTSEQAVKGTAMLKAYIAEHGTAWIDPVYTYLFEIIYPSNRIVVDYGNVERLALLAVIHTQTGAELDINEIDYPDKAKLFESPEALEHLQGKQLDNAEGYVVRFRSGLRVKMKFDEYKRLHRILTRVSATIIWEILAVEEMHNMFPTLPTKALGQCLRLDQGRVEAILVQNGRAFEAMLDNIPDEFYTWVQNQVKTMRTGYEATIHKAEAVVDGVTERLEIIKRSNGDKVTQALAFCLLDQKLSMAHGTAWRAVKPEYSRPFSQDIDA